MAEVYTANKMRKEQSRSNLSIRAFIALTAVFAGATQSLGATHTAKSVESRVTRLARKSRKSIPAARCMSNIPSMIADAAITLWQ